MFKIGKKIKSEKFGETSFWVPTVITVTTVTTVSTITVKYKMLLLYCSKVNFFTNVLGMTTNRPTGNYF